MMRCRVACVCVTCQKNNRVNSKGKCFICANACENEFRKLPMQHCPAKQTTPSKKTSEGNL